MTRILRNSRRLVSKLVTGVDLGKELAELHGELASLRRDLPRTATEVGPAPSELDRIREELASLHRELVLIHDQMSSIHEALVNTPEHLLAADGFPNPPVLFRHLVTGGHDYIPSFFEMGSLCAQRIIGSLEKQGRSLEDLQGVLDFGCGCGRTIRYFRSLGKEKLYGTDYNPQLIDWCRKNLPFAQFDVNELDPPLRYPDGTFDLVYAFSVFTHLTEQLQHAWMAEMRRIIRPGGYLAMSTIDENHMHFPFVDDATKDRIRAGEFAVVNPGSAGGNDCMSYHPLRYMKERMAQGFEIVEHVPNGVGQTFYLLQKSQVSSAA